MKTARSSFLLILLLTLLLAVGCSAARKLVGGGASGVALAGYSAEMVSGRVVDFDVSRNGRLVVFLTDKGVVREVVLPKGNTRSRGTFPGAKMVRLNSTGTRVAVLQAGELKIASIATDSERYKVCKVRGKMDELLWTPANKGLVYFSYSSNGSLFVRALSNRMLHPMKRWLRMPVEATVATVTFDIVKQKPRVTRAMRSLTMDAPRFSPDGSRILFAFGGALYTSPARGYKMKRVWKYGATNPRWMPNGLGAVFEKVETSDGVKGILLTSVPAAPKPPAPKKAKKAKAKKAAGEVKSGKPAGKGKGASKPTAKSGAKPSAKKKKVDAKSPKPAAKPAKPAPKPAAAAPKPAPKKPAKKRTVAAPKRPWDLPADPEPKMERMDDEDLTPKDLKERLRKLALAAKRKAKAARKAKERALRDAITPRPHKVLSTFGKIPVPSPAGDRVLFHDDYGNQIGLYVVSTSGGTPVRLTRLKPKRYGFALQGSVILLLLEDGRLVQIRKGAK